MNFPGGAVPSTYVPAASLYGTVVQPNIMASSSCARSWQWATYGPTKSRKPR
jgi:hypothetical protein